MTYLTSHPSPTSVCVWKLKLSVWRLWSPVGSEDWVSENWGPGKIPHETLNSWDSRSRVHCGLWGTFGDRLFPWDQGTAYKSHKVPDSLTYMVIKVSHQEGSLLDHLAGSLRGDWGNFPPTPTGPFPETTGTEVHTSKFSLWWNWVSWICVSQDQELKTWETWVPTSGDRRHKSQKSGLASGLVGLWGPFQGQALASVLGDPKTSTANEGISGDWDTSKFIGKSQGGCNNTRHHPCNRGTSRSCLKFKKQCSRSRLSLEVWVETHVLHIMAFNNILG